MALFQRATPQSAAPAYVSSSHLPARRAASSARASACSTRSGADRSWRSKPRHRSPSTWASSGRQRRVELLRRPPQRPLLRCHLAACEAVEHPAHGGDEVALSPADVEADPAGDVGDQVRDLLPHPCTDGVGRDRLHERRRRRASQHDAALAQRPAGDFGVAVRRPLHLTPAVVDVEPLPAQAVKGAKVGQQGVGALEVTSPVTFHVGR